MPSSRQGGLVGEVQPGPYTGLMLYLGWALSLVAVYSEVCRPKLQKCGGTRPGRCGGRACLAAVSFLSLSGGPKGPVGVEAPGSRPVHGSWTAPARIREGTQGIASLKGCSCNCSRWGGVSGLGRGRFSFRAYGSTALSCNGCTA